MSNQYSLSFRPAEIPVDRKQKGLRKMRVDSGARNGRPALNAENHSVPDIQPEEIDPHTDIDDSNADNVMVIQELVESEYHRMRECPENYDTGQRLDAGEIQDSDTPTIESKS
jgi:hypothetical protein